MEKKVDDYLNFGVRYVWVIDPRTRKAFAYTSYGMHRAKDALRTGNPAIEIPLSEIFE